MAWAEDPQEPLGLQEHGSFFVGGQDEQSDGVIGPTTVIPGNPAVTTTGTLTVGQMYVLYQIPVHAQRVPSS